MSMSLSVGRIPCLRPSLPLHRSTPLASSTAPTQASPPNLHFAVEYLVQSCGLSSAQALRASKHIPHLKSPEKPDTVLCFLREIGLSESDIRAAVSRDPRILCSHVEKNWRPNIGKLQELGFSTEFISGLISRNPHLFRFNFLPKLDFWMEFLGSVESLSVVLKVWGGAPLGSNWENVIMPNLSFLQEECGLSPRQIVRLMKSAPRVISYRPEIVKMKAEKAAGLVNARSSGIFTDALIVVCCLSQHTIDARLNNLRNLGLSLKEVDYLVGKAPLLLTKTEEMIGRKMEFLMKEAGIDKLHVIRNPFLLMSSLENRLIPRNLVRKLLMSKGLPGANLKFASFIRPSDKEFVEKFVLPHENAIPDLHRAYADAGKIGGVE
ncbi:transcription termination factor MTEF18, mitochondrial-like [Carex rostrata]